jgi:hypothetical protein
MTAEAGDAERASGQKRAFSVGLGPETGTTLATFRNGGIGVDAVARFIEQAGGLAGT